MKLTALALMMGLVCSTGFAAAADTPGAAPAAGSKAAPAAGATGTAGSTGSASANAASPAAGGVSAICKDGTTFSGTSKKGACSGHKGVKTWNGAEMTSSTGEAKAATAASGRASSAPLATAAAGGGAGKVWVNLKSNTYHCQSDRFYGKTKDGAYMTEAEAKTKGAHADHGKACS